MILQSKFHSTFNASSGNHPGGDWTGAASAKGEAGVTAEAELKSYVGVAAEVERGKDQL